MVYNRWLFIQRLGNYSWNSLWNRLELLWTTDTFLIFMGVSYKHNLLTLFALKIKKEKGMKYLHFWIKNIPKLLSGHSSSEKLLWEGKKIIKILYVSPHWGLSYLQKYLIMQKSSTQKDTECNLGTRMWQESVAPPMQCLWYLCPISLTWHCYI